MDLKEIMCEIMNWIQLVQIGPRGVILWSL